MIIGIPKEIKNGENRVAITQSGVEAFVRAGHTVIIEKNAGAGSGISDSQYQAAGAAIKEYAKDVFSNADLILKVKEPLECEYDLLKNNQILFTYLHLAANKALTQVLLEKNILAVAYETIQLDDGSLPLLTPMSEVAGRMSVQIGAHLLEKQNGGSGKLLGGVPGVSNAAVTIIGGGIVGINAAKMAIGLGADVTILDISLDRLRFLDSIFNGKIKTLVSNSWNIAEAVEKSDLLIGAVLIPGAKAPRIVTEKMIKTMTKGSVVVDVAIDQGGSIETIDRVTTHENPYYEKHGVIHYSVANIPGSVSATSTYALTNATVPYALKLANSGLDAFRKDRNFAKGINTINGNLVNKAVANALNIELSELQL